MTGVEICGYDWRTLCSESSELESSLLVSCGRDTDEPTNYEAGCGSMRQGLSVEYAQEQECKSKSARQGARERERELLAARGGEGGRRCSFLTLRPPLLKLLPITWYVRTDNVPMKATGIFLSGLYE